MPPTPPPARVSPSPPATPTATPAELSALAASLYAKSHGGALLRLLQQYRPYIAPFEELLPLVPPGSRVLDVGCGGGLFLHLLAARVGLAASLGFDSSAAAITVASEVRHRTALAGLSPAFVHVGVESPWPGPPACPKVFDVVSIIDVMHHVPPGQQQKLIQTAASRVATNGILIYKDMCRRPFWRACANRLHDLLLARQWINYAPIQQVEVWARHAGLVLEKSASFNRWWYGHELRVFRNPAG